MAKLIRRRRRVEVSEHRLEFDRLDEPGRGYSFECDAEGNVDRDGMNEAARDNYDRARANAHLFAEPYVLTLHRHYYESAVAACSCGRHVTLDGDTNRCERCGAFYNGGGQRLADPSQWGEETGERFDRFGNPIL
jgi:hypothetical protein